MFGFGKAKKKEATVDDVARLLIPKLQALRGDRTYQFDAEVDVIRTSDGAVIGIENLHMDYLRVAEDARDQLLQKFALGICPPPMPKSLEEARPHLLPALRNLNGLDLSRITIGAAAPEMVTHGMLPFTEELGVGVVFDTEHSMAQLDDATFTEWGCTAERAYAIALDNLQRKSPVKFKPLAPGLFMSDYGDYYDAPRILLPELIAQLPVKGTPVAMVPNRGCLLVAGDQDMGAIASMIQVATKMLREESRPLGTEFLRLTDGRWQAAVPPGALGTSLRNMRVDSRAADYKAQKDAIDQQNAKAQRDIFVASCTLHQKKTGELFTYCVLTKGLGAWLPQVDVVMLLESMDTEKDPPKMVPWSEFEREAGHLLEALPYTLPRYNVTAHPDASMVARMAAAELGG